ncbi:MAG TPA: hypothetical protein VFM56_12695 [Solimonas sp.]|nr:hypothetical protein [Solimonas sp.]
MTARTYREASRTDWYRSDGGQPDLEQMKLGAMQRIADAAEKMAQRHTELIGERDWYERKYKQEQAANRRLCYQLRGARGQVTKARRAALQAEQKQLEAEAARRAATVSANRRENAFLIAIGFAAQAGERAGDFLKKWEIGDWDAIDRDFPEWAVRCEKLKHVYRGRL